MGRPVMKCDTCGRETALVQRVVVSKDYNRSLARPLYNCPECFQKKEQAKGSPNKESKGR